MTLICLDDCWNIHLCIKLLSKRCFVLCVIWELNKVGHTKNLFKSSTCDFSYSNHKLKIPFATTVSIYSDPFSVMSESWGWLYYSRGRSRTAATSKMEHFVVIVNGWKLLPIITKSSTLDVSAVLDPPLLLDKWFLCWCLNWLGHYYQGKKRFNVVFAL